ncbi:hypothetical protein DE146DRAFT_247 [Phaeosphaeria sp. MPI-PUGE-AT-0046c]|nr:hypothetical protein DE146DRAFT_247 [Phaeosphaeria sp. MPI-PUGE-AT-0046c]
MNMFTPPLFLFFVTQTVLMVVVGCYKIDPSCTKEGIENDVRDAMTSAFEMVDAAMRRLTASNWDQDTTDLVGRLFAREGESTQNVQTGKLAQVFENIRIHYRTEVTNGNAVENSDLTIFCNRDRFKLIDKDKQIWQDESNGVFVGIDDRICQGRPLPKDKTEKIALAITVNPWRDVEGSTGDDTEEQVATQIQLCPWFVDWIKQRKIKLHRHAIKTMIGKAVIKLSEKTPFGFAQIGECFLIVRQGFAARDDPWSISLYT